MIPHLLMYMNMYIIKFEGKKTNPLRHPEEIKIPKLRRVICAAKNGLGWYASEAGLLSAGAQRRSYRIGS